MKIEIKKLKVSNHLSEETTAYTAEVWVDGNLAFFASNHGTGGCDEFHSAKGAAVTLKAVEAWLATNEAPSGPFEPDPAKRGDYDTGSACDLETFIQRRIDAVDAEKQFNRLLTKIVVLEDGGISTYPAKHKPTPENLDKVRELLAKRGKGGEVVNNASEDVVRRARAAFGIVEDNPAEEVYERLRENRLTAADARWLLAKEAQSPSGTADYVEHLTKVAEEQEARYAEFEKERDARTQQIRAATAR